MTGFMQTQAAAARALVSPPREMAGLSAAFWGVAALASAGLAATSPEAALAHSGWCLASGPADAFQPAMMMGHCIWCHVAAASAALGLASLAAALRRA